ncbi:MAG TPA: ABC transporter substrate-binding protein [Chloroflexota bacterium]|nr:ABC transporter substrate-binding protein [Chloroflexota bacterium]
MRFLSRAAVSVAALGLLLSACGGAAPPAPASSSGAPGTTAAPASAAAPDNVTFIAGYKPQADVSFVGPYVAQAKGFYRQEHLNVTIKHVVQTGENYKLVEAKQADVTTAPGADIITGIANEGVPLIAIAMLTQRGDGGFVTLASSGITSPKQWEGKTVGYKGFPGPVYLGLLKKFNVDRSKIHEVSVGYDPMILAQKKVDVLPVFLSNEPDILEKAGYKVNVLDPANYGITFLGQTWVVNAAELKTRPDVLRRWLKASLEGLYYAFAHPKEAIDIVMQYAPQEDRAHQTFMLGVEQKNSITDLTKQRGLGWMTAAQWSATQTLMVQTDQVKQPLDVSRYFTTSLLSQIYKGGQLIWP